MAHITRRAAMFGAPLAAAIPIAVAPANPDAELIRLCDEFMRLEAEARAFMDLHDAPNMDDSGWRVIKARQETVMDEFCDIDAQTPEGIRAKARAAAAYEPEMLNGQAGWNDHMVASLLRDLVGGAQPTA